MVNAQEWLDRNYPKEKRKKIIELNIKNKDLKGSLKLEKFENLKTFICQGNSLNNLDFSDCPNLDYLDCSINSLTDVNALLKTINPKQIGALYLYSNKFTEQTLDCFGNLPNLRALQICNMPFYGGLWSL